MSVPYRKKLIEVALPLEAINKESAREKSIRHGHPSTLHLWWARRPLAACRAVLFASLVDDPDSDPTFRKPDGSVDEERAGYRRAELFNLIEELVKWENSNNESVINRARAEIAASVASRKILDTKAWKRDDCICGEKAWEFVKRTAKPQAVNAFLAEHAPPVLDPFCGGGSIPLEAQRLGLRAHGSDLNPVPVLITKALIEIPPKFANQPPVNPESRKQGKLHQTWKGAQGLAEDVRYYGQWMRNQVEKQIGDLYQDVKVTAEMAKGRPDLKRFIGEKLTVIAWVWARTVASSSPAYQGVHVPLISSYWLGRKAGKEAWLEASVDREAGTYKFDVRTGSPTTAQKTAIENGTKIGRGCKFRCILSNDPIPEEHIKKEGMDGRLGTVLMAAVTAQSSGRVYLSSAMVPTPPKIDELDTSGISVPIADDKRAIWCLLYGLNSFDKLFLPRQLKMLCSFSDAIRAAREKVISDAASSLQSLRDNDGVSYADAIATYLAFVLDRTVDRSSTICSWDSSPKMEALRGTFARQGIPMNWDFAEGNPFSESSGNWNNNIEWVAKTIDHLMIGPPGVVKQLDATAAVNGVQSPLVSTDPPYYDNIGYADLSDFFYVWLRRSLSRYYPQLFATLVTPKAQELIASPYRHNGSKAEAKAFFEEGLAKAFSNARAAENDDYPVTIYYAFKQSEGSDTSEDDEGIASTGWETMLEAIIASGFSISGTWPMRTELSNRMVGMGANALASSIVLVCLARPKDAPLATRREFLNSLKRQLPDALKHLQRGNIAPVDLAQASIGPGMAVFTRFAKVMEADGSPMRVRQALALINQTLDEVLAEQEGEFDADTRWALAWFEENGMEDGPFGRAETLSKAKNVGINGLVEAGIVQARGGKVRLLKRDELPDGWDPATDTRLRHWEIVQYLIRALDTGGETAAADLLRRIGGMGEVARDLAYRLYNICDRKGWANEALAYNSLVIAWPEISKLAQQQPREMSGQGTLSFEP